MANDRTGRRVTVMSGMKEFVGQTGTVVGKEDSMWRVRLDEPVMVPLLGLVHDDLWLGSFLKTLRNR